MQQTQSHVAGRHEPCSSLSGESAFLASVAGNFAVFAKMRTRAVCIPDFPFATTEFIVPIFMQNV